MIFQIITKGGKLLSTYSKTKAQKALAEGGKKASKKFIERVKNRKEYNRKLKQRYQARKRKEGDPVYAAKAEARQKKSFKHQMKMLHSSKYFDKIISPEYRRAQATTLVKPRVAGRVNPKQKTAIPGMPVQKKSRGGMTYKKGGFTYAIK
jgi:hypothetical protein